MASFARLLIHVFFRTVETDGGENLPASGPVVVVANHTNGLVDGLLLMAALRRYPRFLGKSTLFRIAPLWPFLKFAGVVPVYRAMDGAPGERNATAFATCHRILAGGGLVALFPEGVSHNESSVQPLRTGAARIALGAGTEGGIDDVTMVAVGLTYDAKARFRSRALVSIGRPFEISPWVIASREDDHQAVREFTTEIACQLDTVSPGYASWDEAAQLSRLAEVVLRQPSDSISPVSLNDRVNLAQRLGQRAREHDAPFAALLSALAHYERDLHLLGLDDAQLAADYQPEKIRASFVWTMTKILAAVPFAVIGALIHVIPFQAVKALARVPTNEGMRATVKLLGCFASFTVVYAAIGFFVGRADGAWAGALASLAAPICGYATVLWAEWALNVGGLLEGYRRVREQRSDLYAIRDERAAMIESARTLLESV